MALPLPPRPSQPIPNNPFYYPEGNFIRGEYGPFIVGGGIFLDYSTGTISAGGTGPGGVNTILAGNGIFVSSNTGGIVTVANTGALSLSAGNGIQVVNNAGNYTIINTLPGSPSSGTVTQINTGAGLVGGPITSAGTVSLATTGVGPGTYTNPTITVDAYGRVTYAAPGASGGSSAVIATAPLRSNGLVPSTISIDNASTLAPGAVQLDDSTTSTSTTKAPTARALNEVFNLANTSSTGVNTAINTANTALTTANNACSIAQTAQNCALQALTNAAIAQGDATQALANAAAAQSTANTALTNASSAQTTANTALASASARIPCSAFLAKGDLLAGTGTGTYVSLAHGTDGQVLVACAACGSGLTWTAPASGGGTVTSITAGTGLNGGTITGSGTIDLADTAVSPGTYTYASITVDQQGRITSASDGTAPVTAVTGTAPISVTAGTTPDVSVAAASTTSAGVVQLNDTLTSNSTTQALTAAQGQVLQNQINALSVATNLTFAGTFDATLGHMDSVTTEGAAEGFALGANLPTPSATNDNFFVIVTVEGSYSPPGGGGPYAANRGDWFLSNGVTWEYLNVGADLPVASTGSQGVVELATVAETQAGTSTTLAVTPAGLAASLPDATPIVKGVMYGCTTNTPAAITSVGHCALAANTTGFCNTSVGSCSLAVNTSGYFNTALGSDVLLRNTTGSDNTGLGFQVMCNNTTGSSNLGVGTSSLIQNTSGTGNSAIGPYSLLVNTTGCFNTAVGYAAMYFHGTGSCNVGLGFYAGCGISSGCNNVAIGPRVQVASATGSCQLAIGYALNCYWITGDSTKAIKPGAGILDCLNTTGGAGQVLMSNGANAICWGTVSIPSVANATPLVAGTVKGCTNNVNGNVSVGCCSLLSVTTGCDNASLGLNSLLCNTTGCYNVAVGSCSLMCNTTSSSQTAVGYGALLNGGTGFENVALGTFSLGAITAGSRNTASGSCALRFNTTGGANTATGVVSLYNNTTGSFNAAHGSCSLVCNLGGGCNTASGSFSLFCNTTGSFNTAVGFQALCRNTTGCSNTAVGCCSLICNVLGDGNTAMGAGALRFNTASCNTAVGTCALGCNTSGTGNTALGAFALCWAQTGSRLTAIGYEAGWTSVGCDNVFIGFCAGRNMTFGCNITLVGSQSLLAGNSTCDNTAVGALTLCCTASGGNTAMGACAGWCGNNSNGVFIGARAGYRNNGDRNTAVGYQSLTGALTNVAAGNTAVGAESLGSITSGACNTALGYGAGGSVISGCSNLLLGAGALSSSFTVSNEVSIYNGSVYARFQGAASAWSFVSDARDKANIENLDVGLTFINQLKPRSFEWNLRNSDVDKGKKAAGFIAQEVDELTTNSNAEYLNLVDKNDPDQYTLAQANLVPVLVKAIQELSAKNDALEARIAQLEANG